MELKRIEEHTSEEPSQTPSPPTRASSLKLLMEMCHIGVCS